MCRALNQGSKRVWLLHVGEHNFGTCQRRFGTQGDPRFARRQ